MSCAADGMIVRVDGQRGTLALLWEMVTNSREPCGRGTPGRQTAAVGICTSIEGSRGSYPGSNDSDSPSGGRGAVRDN